MADKATEKKAPAPASSLKESANFIFKRKYGKFFGAALTISFLSHLIFILSMPTLSAEIQFRDESAMESIELPPEVVIPPPPKALTKPAIPMEAEEELDEDITIDETTPPPPDLIPEMPQVEGQSEAEEFLMVAEVMPKFKFVPPQPKMPQYIARARVEVSTKIEFFVTKTGDVDATRTKIAVSSGYPELDQIAVEWAKQIKFHPALNRGEPVAVRVAVPIKWVSK